MLKNPSTLLWRMNNDWKISHCFLFTYYMLLIVHALRAMYLPHVISVTCYVCLV